MKKITRKNLGQLEKRRDSAFTFIETLAVLAVTAILTSQVGIAAHKMIQKARIASAKSQIEQIKLSLQNYFADCGRFPTQEQGLDALWEEPQLFPLAENWNGPYTDRKISTDPWGSEFIYLVKDSAGESLLPKGLPFGIISLGADRAEGGSGNDKDIFSWE
ncbi:MAG: type II secretion system major pseudopilin GspG [Treponema sp.]|nr:type II secretion system major pseudopilin GspG [Treponema sp.]